MHFSLCIISFRVNSYLDNNPFLDVLSEWDQLNLAYVDLIFYIFKYFYFFGTVEF